MDGCDCYYWIQESDTEKVKCLEKEQIPMMRPRLEFSCLNTWQGH